MADLEYYRQQRIKKLMGLEEELALKTGQDIYHEYVEAFEGCKAELNKPQYTGPKLYEMIEATKETLGELLSNERIEYTARLHRNGTLSRRDPDSSHER